MENVNAGSADGEDTLQQVQSDPLLLLTHCEASTLVTPGAHLLQVSLCERSRTELESLLDKLKTAVRGERLISGLNRLMMLSCL